MTKEDARTVAWIFLAISHWDKELVSRSELELSADQVALAVPSDDEFDLAFRFLAGHGLIEERDDGFTITDAGHLLIGPAYEGKANIFESWEALEDRIASIEAP
jgi:hypothetical protein